MLSVSRRPCEIAHPKLEEYIVEDFITLPVDDPKLQGYDAWKSIGRVFSSIFGASTETL